MLLSRESKVMLRSSGIQGGYLLSAFLVVVSQKMVSYLLMQLREEMTVVITHPPGNYYTFLKTYNLAFLSVKVVLIKINNVPMVFS